MKDKPTVILWTTAYADLLTGNSIGGIGVQMMFWAKVFIRNRWNVISLYNDVKPADYPNGVEFRKDLQTHSWNFIIYIFFALRLLIKTKPNLVICRGGRNRNLLFIAFLCKIMRTKLVQFFGSDADLRKNYSEIPTSVRFNIGLFRLGLRFTQYFVVQNEEQKNLLLGQFNDKHVLLCPNIWESVSTEKNKERRNIILWVGNTRKLKRPEWVFEIASNFPDQQFVMIGGNADKDVYDKCVKLSDNSANVSFLGRQPFFETSKWFEKAKILLCTSEYEGFPNTFLQAWSNDIPVLSTVNPSNIISSRNLGVVCNDINNFKVALQETLDPAIYSKISENIHSYFESAHSLNTNYYKLMGFIKSN
ncbi:MAG: glycosyltransferase [Muribaculum sp.]|nr:glycosyltransferase [Muribaculum sp.]